MLFHSRRSLSDLLPVGRLGQHQNGSRHLGRASLLDAKTCRYFPLEVDEPRPHRTRPVCGYAESNPLTDPITRTQVPQGFQNNSITNVRAASGRGGIGPPDIGSLAIVVGPMPREFDLAPQHGGVSGGHHHYGCLDSRPLIEDRARHLKFETHRPLNRTKHHRYPVPTDRRLDKPTVRPLAQKVLGP